MGRVDIFGKFRASLKAHSTTRASLGLERENLKVIGDSRAKELREREEKKTVSSGESQEQACGRLLGLLPNSWFHLDFCVINRHLPVSLPHVSSKPLLPYKENPL